MSPGLPGWLLRAMIGVLAAAMIIVVASQGLETVLLGLFVFVGVVAVAFPGSPAATLLIAGVVITTAFEPGDPLRLTVLILIPLIQLTHISSALAAVLPSNGRLHLTALRAPARRFLLVQAVVFALVGVAALVPAGRVNPVIEVVGLLGAAGLALFGAILVRQGRG